MANRNFPASRVFGQHLMPIRLDAQISIGSSGAPTISNGIGIASVTRLSAGTYRIQLQDNYYQLLNVRGSMRAPVSGGSVTAGSFNTGTVYQITALGTTNWHTAGLPAGLTAAVGMTFKAAAAGSGTGTAKVIGNSGIISVESIGTNAIPNPMLNNQPFVAGSGGFIDIQCLGASFTAGAYTPAGTNSAPALTMNSYTPAGTNDSATPPIFTGTPATLTGTVAAPVFTGSAASLTGTVSMVATDPANGSTMVLEIWLNNSSVQ